MRIEPQLSSSKELCALARAETSGEYGRVMRRLLDGGVHIESTFSIGRDQRACAEYQLNHCVRSNSAVIASTGLKVFQTWRPDTTFSFYICSIRQISVISKATRVSLVRVCHGWSTEQPRGAIALSPGT